MLDKDLNGGLPMGRVSRGEALKVFESCLWRFKGPKDQAELQGVSCFGVMAASSMSP
jgi:hypothetical protein